MANRSFSGTHAYNADHVTFSIEMDWTGVEGFDEERVRRLAQHHADRITADLERSVCPRCRGPLDPDRAAGSRITTCRCIPICPACGDDEAYQPALGRPMSRAWEWPIGKGARTRRKNKIEANSKPMTLTLGDHGLGIISPEGVAEVKMRKHPGGWAEYGHDDDTNA